MRRGFEQIHSELFSQESKVLRAPLTQPSLSSGTHTLVDCEDKIPSLCDSSKIHASYPDVYEEHSQHRNFHFHNASMEEVSAFDHHCKFSAMRSMLSRVESENLFSNSSPTDPCISQIVSAGKDMSEDDLNRFLNVLKLKILNG